MSVLTRSGNLAAAALLHNRVYQLYDFRGSACEVPMELVLFDDTAFLDGEKLYFVYFDPVLRCVQYNYGKGAASRSGSLFFSDDFLTILGAIQGADGQLRQVMGGSKPLKYQAVAKDSSGNEQQHRLELGTRQGKQMIEPYYKLDDVDITSTTAIVKVDPGTKETTIVKVTDPVGFGPYDNVSFTIVLRYDGKRFTGTYTENSCIYGPIKYTFTGRATEESLQTARANDRQWKARDGAGLERCPHPSRFSQEVRDAIPLAGEATLLELLNINPVEIVSSGGQQVTIDHAQETAGKYFQDILTSYLEEPYVTEFFGGKPALPANVQKISDTYAAFYKKHVADNMAQILYDNCRTGGSQAQTDACNRIRIQTVKNHWKTVGIDDPDYTKQTDALYLEGYRDGVMSIQPYLKDGVKWAEQLAGYLMSSDFLDQWRVQVASLMFDHVKERIYGFYSKLLVLDGSAEGQKRAQTVVHTMLGSIIYVGGSISVYTEENQDVITELLAAQVEELAGKEELPEKLKEYAQFYQDTVATFGSAHIFAGMLFKEIADLTKKSSVAAEASEAELSGEAGEEMTKDNPGWKETWKKHFAIAKPAIGMLVSAGAAAFMLYSMVTTAQKEKMEPKDVVAELSMGELVLMSLLKAGQNLMDTKIGTWLAEKLSASTSGFAKFAESFSKWFTKEGVAADNIFSKLFGKNSRVFCQRFLGPVVILTGVVLGGFMLADAVKRGQDYEIVLDSLNLVMMVGELVSWGLAMFGFSWAGPLGCVFAAAGFVVMIIQFLWGLISPPKGPVEEYVDRVLVPANLADAA